MYVFSYNNERILCIQIIKHSINAMSSDMKYVSYDTFLEMGASVILLQLCGDSITLTLVF